MGSEGRVAPRVGVSAEGVRKGQEVWGAGGFN